jgi:pyridoxal phosphate enzyme (YggS family)
VTIADRVGEVEARIAAVCAAAGRDRSEVALIAASKGSQPAAMREAYEAGIRAFGENYLQEYLRKRPACPPDIDWHFLGRVQSNKAAAIGREFRTVHSLDSLDKARLLAKGAEGPPLGVFVEVNIANEPRKAGIRPEEVAEFCETVYHLPGVQLRGLMTMGPANQKGDEARHYFKLLGALLGSLHRDGVAELSMGMTDDFEVAIQEGATHVRVGTAIFGRREEI